MEKVGGMIYALLKLVLTNCVFSWKYLTFWPLQAAKNSEILKLHKMLEDESRKKAKHEEDISILQSRLLQISFEADEVLFVF